MRRLVNSHSNSRRNLPQAKMVSIIQGGHVKISSPSLRPRLYLHSGDKGYTSAGSAANSNTNNRGGASTGARGDEKHGSRRGRRERGGEGVDRLAENERQVASLGAALLSRSLCLLDGYTRRCPS